jgi:tetratricopeptide (TPR) repeat protein
MTILILKNCLRANWHLLLTLAAIAGVMVAYHLRQAEQAPVARAASAPAVKAPGGVATESGGIPGRLTEREKAETIIARHRADVEADPDSADAPAKLNAMGNLYRQKLRDYRNAAQCYELLLHDYPDWEGIRATYIQLASCYEKLEDRTNLRRVYEAMMERFPPDSQEHQYARSQLEW